jgi:predicted amidohydrolase
MEDIRIALAQINCPVGDLEHNLEKHSQCIYRARDAGAQIICFPETSLTGYPNTKGLPHDLAQPLEGELTQSIVEVSTQTGVIVLAGLVERDRSGVIYNTQLVASPDGLAGAYRKTHVGNSEIHRFSRGDELPVFTLAGLTFGIQICYDNHFPEASRTLALRGADVIFCPYGSPAPCNEEGMAAKRSRWLRYLPARAFDNSVYMAVVNQVGQNMEAQPGQTPDTGVKSSTGRDTHVDMPEFPGASMVLNPWGEMMAEVAAPVEEVLIVDLTAAGLQDKRSDALQFFTHFRRPELYAELVQPSRPRLERLQKPASARSIRSAALA